MKDTTESLSADQQFLVNMEEKCRTAEEDYNARQKERSSEQKAIGEAVGINTVIF